MKKILAAVLAAVILISTAACSQSGTVSEPEPSGAAGDIQSAPVSAPQSAEESLQTSEEPSEEESMEQSEPVIERTWPCVCGTFVQPGAFTSYDVEKWKHHFDYLKEVGIDIFIIQWTAETPDGKFKDVYYPSEYASAHAAGTVRMYPDFLPSVLEAAQDRGIKVFVGLNLSDEWWSYACTRVNWNKAVSLCGTEMAKEIYSLYKEKYPDALYGWYFAYEMFNGMQGYETRAGEFLNMYLEPLTDLDPSMPMMLSPFVQSAGGSAAKAEQEWKKVFETASFREGDIFCCQDAVGAGHINISQLEAYFAALRRAVDTEPGLKFWANSEDFTKDYDSAYVSRFIKQMEIASPYVENFVTFAYSHYYAKDYNGKGGFHRAYKHYYDTGDKSPSLEPPALSFEQRAGGKSAVSCDVVNNAAGIRYITFSASGREDYVNDYPVSRLDRETFNVKHTFVRLGDEEAVTVTVTLTDYYGNTSSSKIVVTFGD